MVISTATTAGEAPTAAIAIPLKRQTLKKRRGLSSFYSSKSQSFNCILDLQSNPFCQSTLVLAKVAHTPASWEQPYGSIQEERMWEQQGDPLSMHPDGCVSEPGSPRAHHSLARHSWPGSSDADECEESCSPPLAPSWDSTPPEECHPMQHLQQQPQGMFAPPIGLHGSIGGEGITLAGSRCCSLGPSLSGSSDGSMYASCDTSFEAMGDAYCCLQQPEDGLCEALKAASLAAAQHNPHAAALLPLAASCNLRTQ